MGVNWTKEQQQVIDLRDRNILVSAAAGSGKTAVLVERIISMLTDPVHPVDVDRLLVVTFTKAAAAEMKERIRDAVEKLLEERIWDEHLQRQATLIHGAQITTIDSFCQTVVREHFHRIDLDPGFRVAEEGELKLLKHDVLEELLEEQYDSGNADFLNFVEAYANGRDDRKLEELILNLYEYSRSYPNPKRWLNDCAAAYGADKEEDAETARKQAELPEKLKERIARLVTRYLRDADSVLQDAYAVCTEADGPYMYEEMIVSDRKALRALLDASSYEEMYEKSEPIRKKTAWKRLSGKKDPAVSVQKREQVKNLRNEVKKIAEEVCGQYFYAPPDELAADMELSRKPMSVLAGLVTAFSEAFSRKKRARNLIDFGDMEQFALQILTKEENGVLVPTPAAQEYQERFAEVMIDEYQDSNLIQEAILTSVSTVSRGKNNMFMVGDVKQSIYRFRLSRPELFMEKFDTYSLEDSDTQRIDLHKNFRSRREVLEGVNFLFRQIMRKDLGGIVYDDQAALYPGADYECVTDDGLQETERSDPACGVRTQPAENSVHRTEVLLVDTNRDGLEDADVTDTDRELEARAVAARIRKLLRQGWVKDRETGLNRRPGYRDIVILTRSVKGWTDVFSEILKKEGIPTYAGSAEGYFETYEVSLLLDYLKILDNQKQDLPLAAVLTSPLCGLNAEELSRLRSAFPNQAFHEAVFTLAESYESCGDHPVLPEAVAGISRATLEKLNRTWKGLSYFREKVPYTAIHDLLWEILEKTGYYHLMTAMPGGAQRKANLDMLLNQAAAFEETSYKGLFNFVRYIEQLKKYDVDYGEANITDEQMDAVRFMSIHKSKGLEFPIVFVCGMSKPFNKQDITGSVVIHPDLGVGIDAVDIGRRTKTPTLLKKLIQKEVLLENLGEELRVLYVALTRAKEKLILTGTLSNVQEKLEKYEELKKWKETALPFGRLSRANSYFDWILPALVRKTEEVPMDVLCVGISELASGTAVELEAEGMAKDVLLNWEADRVYDPARKEDLEQQITYEYPYAADQRMKLKFTVSELKKRSYLAEETDEGGQDLFEEPDVIPLLPKFLQKTEELTGASRGSAYHRVLELLDFSETYDRSRLQETITGFAAEEKLTGEMAACVRFDDILEFLSCGLGRRMQEAAAKGTLRKEQPFVLSVDAAEVYSDTDSSEPILVQGIIDVYFEEPDGLVLLDYKTDQVRSGEQLCQKYRAQLQYYTRALEQLTGKVVKEKWIYSFTLREEILV